MKPVSHIPFFVCFMFFLGLQPVAATLLQQDDSRFGANSLTLDTRTGLAWLDLSFTTGMSYQQVLAATAPTGSFSGFRYATASEVLDLYTSASIPGPGDYLVSSPVGDAVVGLISLIGATSFQDGHPEAIGISGTRDGFGRDVLWCDFFYSVGVPEYDVLGPGGFIIGESFGFPDKGSWLVTAIPEPSVALLGAIGLLLFCRSSSPVLRQSTLHKYVGVRNPRRSACSQKWNFSSIESSRGPTTLVRSS